MADPTPAPPPQSGPAPGEVPVWTPTGELAYMAAGDFDQSAIIQGYREASPEELHNFLMEQKYGTAGEIAKTVGEGALQTLAPVVGSKVEQALGARPEDILGRRETNPIAHGVGAVGAAVAATAATAGLGAPAAAGRFTAPGLISAAERGIGGLAGPGAGMAARVLLPAARGAFAGGAYGLTDVAERHFLGDPNLTTEKAMAEVGLSALIPGALAGGTALLGEALRPLGQRLIDKGAKAAEAKALIEADAEQAKLAGSVGGTASDAYRKYKDIRDILLDPTSTVDNRAAARAFLESEEGSVLREAAQGATLAKAPELAAELAGKRGALEEFIAARPAQIAARTAELQAPGRLGSLLNERVVQRYGGRAGFGMLLGQMTGLGKGVGTALGLNFGPMKAVIQRIARDPTMYSTLGNFLLSPAKTLSTMLEMSRLTSMTDDAIADGIGAIFGAGTAKVTSEVAGKLVDPRTYLHVASNLSGYSNNLDGLASHTTLQTDAIQDHLPGSSDALHALAARGVQLLQAKIPRAEAREPLDPPYQPSAAELARYNRFHEIAEKPTVILHKVAEGTLSPEHIEAAQAVYPSLLAEMRLKTTDRLASEISKGRIIPYKTRLALSMFLGKNMDSSLSYQSMQANQAAFAMPTMQPSAPARPSRAAGADKITIAQRSKMDLERVAGRRA
jgi:hypothetical protein